MGVTSDSHTDILTVPISEGNSPESTQAKQNGGAQMDGEKPEGRYLYCIIDSGVETSFGDIGINNSRVYTIPHKDISAVVHNCAAEPYASQDEEKVKEWVLSHQYAIDLSMEKFGNVIPFSFDAIIRGDEKTVQTWLSDAYPRLKQELERIRNKAEFGVQIFWDLDIIIPKIEETSEELRKLKESMKQNPEGIAYMLKKKSEKLLKKELTLEADRCSRDFYNKIRKYADEVQVERTGDAKVPKKWQNKSMILNMCCLVHGDRVSPLGMELEKINKTEGFSVRFTGPWAPFSFVGRRVI